MNIPFLTVWYGRLRAAFPALAFFGGFVWDAFTLGRAIQPFDLFTLLAYLVGAGILLLWMGRREVKEAAGAEAVPESAPAAPALGAMPRLLHMAREEGPTMALQFFFGGMFSALVIFYFLSSSYLPGFAVVGLLTVLLGLNEFLEGHYRRRFTLTWTLFCLCAILFLNFALPHLFHSVSAIWFYVSTAAGLALVFFVRRLSPKVPGSLWPSVAVAAVLVGLFVVNAIPPVPLVKKNVAICRELEKKEGAYSARIEKPPLYAFWRRSETVVHQRPGEKVFCFTSVFLPTGIECRLFHAWRFKEPRTGKWTEWSRIGFPIRGGRQEGYRGYTYKQNLADGRWQVRVETEDRRVLGTIRFTVISAAAETPLVFRDLMLH
jgi:hypothetical protein